VGDHEAQLVADQPERLAGADIRDNPGLGQLVRDDHRPGQRPEEQPTGAPPTALNAGAGAFPGTVP
jgi:hypothetical protein